MKVSIVIPYFNSSKYLKIILFSIQDYINREDIEIIFVDDCSSFNESNSLQFFIQSLDAINVLYKKNEINLGASKSRKEGVLLSKGKYIAFLDSDDAWVPGKIDYQFEIMEKNNLVITGCLTRFIEENDLNSDFIKSWKFSFTYKPINFFNFLFKNFFSTPSVMVLRNSILENNFSDKLRYAEDYECWRRVLSAHKGAVISDLGVFSFKHSYISKEGLSSNIFKMSIYELVGLFWIFSNSSIDFKYKLILPSAITYSFFKSLRRFFLYYLSYLK